MPYLHFRNRWNKKLNFFFERGSFVLKSWTGIQNITRNDIQACIQCFMHCVILQSDEISVQFQLFAPIFTAFQSRFGSLFFIFSQLPMACNDMFSQIVHFRQKANFHFWWQNWVEFGIHAYCIPWCQVWKCFWVSKLGSKIKWVQSKYLTIKYIISNQLLIKIVL